jgi:hypothetical protein
MGEGWRAQSGHSSNLTHPTPRYEGKRHFSRRSDTCFPSRFSAGRSAHAAALAGLIVIGLGAIFSAAPDADGIPSIVVAFHRLGDAQRYGSLG